MSSKKYKIVGYSGHAYVVLDAILKCGDMVVGYFDTTPKTANPFDLQYLGRESEESLLGEHWFVAIGDNNIREQICRRFESITTLSTVIHPSSIIGAQVAIEHGTFVAANAIINPLASIGKGVIINTGAIIEHECALGAFVHVAPGAVLTGQVRVGDRSFIGANAVLKQNVVIGEDVIVGAGAVVIENVPSNTIIVGNPARIISQSKHKS